MTTITGTERLRSSIDKKPIMMADTPPAFDRLPDEIIQQILQATDSNGFASLALLNTKWRSVAQQAHLYAYHLRNCPSYSMSHPGAHATVSDEDLPNLRRLFAREVKRNLFQAYLRPSKTIIKLISNSISSSSCPGGEGIQFSPSPKGHHLLAYNSSRIYVIDTRGSQIAVKREFKILRRPAATCIKDDGMMLAVLLTEMQVDIYDLSSVPPKRSQSIILDHSPRSIALSPCGNVLAAAYEGGIEVSALGTSSLSTDRRAVKCDAVDTLAFSFDGTQILGTTVHSSQPNTVILTAPYYDPGSLMADDNMSALWTTSILFPNTSRDCSHAVLIQSGKYEEAAWTFTYDRSFETFRAVRIDDLRNGTTYFTGPVPSPTSQAKLIPCTLPAASYYGELVSAGFQAKEIWLYGVPEDLDAVPDSSNGGSDSGSNLGSLHRRNSGPSPRAAPRAQESDAVRVPQWQLICDKHRNTFVGGYKIGELDGVSMVKWVADFGNSTIKERLIVAARSVTPGVSIADDEGINFVDGGRLTLVEFDYSVRDGECTEITIEVGTREPEVLEEEHRDMATEVAIVRRRTVAQQRGNRSAVMRAATTTSRPPPMSSQSSTQEKGGDDEDPLQPRRIGVPPPRVVEPAGESDEAEEGPSIEEQEALDAPYAHASPRSGTTLRRAATAAAANRRLHPPAAAAGQVQYRRADGRAEHPHESDADNWVPPPPPYQKEDPGDLPVFLRHAISNTQSGPDAEHSQNPQTATGPQPDAGSSTSQQPRRTATTARHLNDPHSGVPPVPPLPQVPPVPPLPLEAPRAPWHRREGSYSSVSSSRDGSLRPGSSNSRYLHGENIYDVSPPESPALGGRAERGSSLRPTDARAVSNPAPGGRTGAMLTPHDTVPAQQQPPSLPRIQTVGSSQGFSGPPALDLQIPSPSLQHLIQGFGSTQQPIAGPGGRRLSNSMTWPAQPNPKTVSAATGYPYSASAANADTSVSLSRVYAAPVVGQPPSLNRGEVPSRQPCGYQVPRIPIGSRDSGEYRRASQRPLSHQQPYPQYQQSPYEPRCHSQPQPQFAQDPPRPGFAPGTPQEDMPLIISTPKGVTGAFDPPDRRISGRRAETPILAPVPRHPRPTAQAVLRPTVERLENISNGVHGSSGISGYLRPPSGPGSGSGSSGFRVASLNRKQSRAERSAAKNIADAKRRGWTGRSRSKSRRKKSKKERDFDVASSAAWTDVTTFSHRSFGFGRSSNSKGLAAGQQGKGDKARCLVM